MLGKSQKLFFLKLGNMVSIIIYVKSDWLYILSIPRTSTSGKCPNRCSSLLFPANKMTGPVMVVDYPLLTRGTEK